MAKSDLQKVKENGYYIQYTDQNEKLCLAAVEQNPFAIRFIHKPSEKVLLKAARLNGYSVKFMQAPSECVCLAAVKQNRYSLEFIEEQTEAICLAAIRQSKNGKDLCDMVRLKTPAITEAMALDDDF